MKKIFIIWVLLMMVATFTVGIVYITMQQTVRLSSNEIALSSAKEVLIKLQNGSTTEQAIPEKTDASITLTPFVLVYDNNENMVISSATMNGEILNYPKGVLKEIETHNENRVTWQTSNGLRYASVGIKYKDGYIIGAVSLTEKEKLIELNGKLIFIAWFSFAVLSWILLYIFKKSGVQIKEG